VAQGQLGEWEVGVAQDGVAPAELADPFGGSELALLDGVDPGSLPGGADRRRPPPSFFLTDEPGRPLQRGGIAGRAEQEPGLVVREDGAGPVPVADPGLGDVLPDCDHGDPKGAAGGYDLVEVARRGEVGGVVEEQQQRQPPGRARHGQAFCPAEP